MDSICSKFVSYNLLEQKLQQISSRAKKLSNMEVKVHHSDDILKQKQAGLGKILSVDVYLLLPLLLLESCLSHFRIETYGQW